MVCAVGTRESCGLRTCFDARTPRECRNGWIRGGGVDSTTDSGKLSRQGGSAAALCWYWTRDTEQEGAVNTQKGESAFPSLRNLRCDLSMGGALAAAELNLKSLSPYLAATPHHRLSFQSPDGPDVALGPPPPQTLLAFVAPLQCTKIRRHVAYGILLWHPHGPAGPAPCDLGKPDTAYTRTRIVALNSPSHSIRTSAPSRQRRRLPCCHTLDAEQRSPRHTSRRSNRRRYLAP